MRINEFEHFTKIGQDKKSDIQALSIEYQIPSSQTAFIASARNTDPVTGDVEFKKIPVTESTFSRGYDDLYGYGGYGGTPVAMSMAMDCYEETEFMFGGGGGGGGGDYGMKEELMMMDAAPMMNVRGAALEMEEDMIEDAPCFAMES